MFERPALLLLPMHCEGCPELAAAPAKAAPGEHNWPDWRMRYITGAEWRTLEDLARYLKAEQLAGRLRKAPAASLIRKRAADEHWNELRTAVEQRALKLAMDKRAEDDAAYLAGMGRENREQGRAMKQLAAKWLQDRTREHEVSVKEAAEDVLAGKPPRPIAPGPINDVKEAALLWKLGAAMEQEAAEMLLDLQELQLRRERGVVDLDKDGDEIVQLDEQPGVVLLPSQLTADAWQAQRRNLAEGGTDAPAAEEPKKP